MSRRGHKDVQHEGAIWGKTMSQHGEAPTMEIARFRELVDRCARTRLDCVIPNGSPVHARILIAKLFETALQHVAIVSGHLTDRTSDGEDIYGDADVVTSARHFLCRPNSQLEIVLDTTVDRGTSNRFLVEVVNDPSRLGVVTLFDATNAISKMHSPHFMVTDALAYRHEMSPAGIQALANFGDEKRAKLLQSLFDNLKRLLKSSSKVPLVFSPNVRFALA